MPSSFAAWTACGRRSLNLPAGTTWSAQQKRMTPTALHQGRVDKTSTLAIIPHASGVEPFDPATTRQRIRSILERGRTGWSRHALSEMAKDT
jgi:hypothetical protein